MKGSLERALQATGFLIGDVPAPGLRLQPEGFDRVDLSPDAVWRDRSRLEVIFKCVEEEPREKVVASWHRDVWNLGVAPLLWVVSPDYIRLYNGYERPTVDPTASEHLLREVRAVDDQLARLDDYAGRLAMASGSFWVNEGRVQRDGRVDLSLLQDLRTLERELCDAELPRDVAQGLVGRSIFLRYLVDRGIVNSDTLPEFGDLRRALGEHGQAYRLFNWVRSTFNGDLFPVLPGERKIVQGRHLELVSETLAGVEPEGGQASLWEYRFDAIPIELISSIYEQFAHVEPEDEDEDKEKARKKDGVHYTPMSVVNLVLDEVMRDLDGTARVFDLTCGSAVFLVEALRRLVRLRAGGRAPSRKLIRETLSGQIFGVDKSASAIRVASFSLYLLALELDPDPKPPEALRFEPLVGRNLFVGNAFDFDTHGPGRRLAGETFDVIVGNPPWTYGGEDRKLRWPDGQNERGPILPPRSQDFAFVWRSVDFASSGTRFGIVMRATPFFSSSESSLRARSALFDHLKPVALVNLSALRDGLFPTADYPAVVVFARVNQVDADRVAVVTVPWTSTFARSGAFEVAPSDVRMARLGELASSPRLLKATAVGTPRDRLLLRKVDRSVVDVGTLLEAMGVRLITGVQTLDGDRKDSSHLCGLPLLKAGRLTPRVNTEMLPMFDKPEVHRPRSRSAFCGPLLIVSEGVRGGIARPAVGVSEADVVYSRSFYGMSFRGLKEELAYRLGGVLLSAVTAWHLLLTGSEFGIHKRKVLRQDLKGLPTPSLEVLSSTDAAPVSSAMNALMESNGYSEEALSELDEAVFDLFGLDEHERFVVLGGVALGKREYKRPRVEADQWTNEQHLRGYAEAFLSVVNPWQSALGRGAYGAEIVGLRPDAPLRLIRFVHAEEAAVWRRGANHEVGEVISRIGARIRLPISESLAAARELRVHAADGEVLIIKPSSRRHWTPVAGLNDADSALGDGLAADAG